MIRCRPAAILALSLLASSAFAQPKGKWINIHVRDAAEQTTVDVRLPLDFIAAAIDAVDTPEFKNGKIRLDFHSRAHEGAVEAEGDVTVHADHPDVNWAPLLKKMKDLPDGEFVKVDSPDAKVSVRRTGGLFLIHVENQQTEEKAKVDVRIPVALLDSFKVDENNRLDIKAFVAELDKLDIGDLVRVSAEGTDVRIWVE